MLMNPQKGQRWANNFSKLGWKCLKLGCNKDLCVFQCGRRKWRSAALPVATGGLEQSEIFGGADGEPLCIQQRQEAAFEAVIPHKKKKKKETARAQLSADFTNELVRKQTHSTYLLLRLRQRCLFIEQFQWNIQVGTNFCVWQTSRHMGLNRLQVLKVVLRILLISGQLSRWKNWNVSRIRQKNKPCCLWVLFNVFHIPVPFLKKLFPESRHVAITGKTINPGKMSDGYCFVPNFNYRVQLPLSDTAVWRTHVIKHDVLDK